MENMKHEEQGAIKLANLGTESLSPVQFKPQQDTMHKLQHLKLNQNDIKTSSKK